jgi:hypothetical protein
MCVTFKTHPAPDVVDYMTLCCPTHWCCSCNQAGPVTKPTVHCTYTADTWCTPGASASQQACHTTCVTASPSPYLSASLRTAVLPEATQHIKDPCSSPLRMGLPSGCTPVHYLVRWWRQPLTTQVHLVMSCMAYKKAAAASQLAGF